MRLHDLIRKLLGAKKTSDPRRYIVARDRGRTRIEKK
jgi:hypothetical protein